MHFSSLLAIPTVLLAGFASAAPSEGIAERAAGPSGYVISPAGNTVIDIFGPYPNGEIDFSYKKAYKLYSDNCEPYKCEIVTAYVSVGLRDAKGKVTMLAENLGSKDNTTPITATLVPPNGFCGSYNLVVKETQIAKGQLYTFQSAAPKINLGCVPIQ